MTIWVIPCNLAFYRVQEAFDNLSCIDWKQSRRIEVGDTVYVYVGRPVKAILYKCRVNKTNLPKAEIDDSAYVIDGGSYENYGNYMELELVKRFPQDALPLEKLAAAGLQGSIQGPRRVTGELLSFVNLIDQNTDIE